jgi:hypothetical protein
MPDTPMEGEDNSCRICMASLSDETAVQGCGHKFWYAKQLGDLVVLQWSCLILSMPLQLCVYTPMGQHTEAPHMSTLQNAVQHAGTSRRHNQGALARHHRLRLNVSHNCFLCKPAQQQEHAPCSTAVQQAALVGPHLNWTPLVQTANIGTAQCPTV